MFESNNVASNLYLFLSGSWGILICCKTCVCYLRLVNELKDVDVIFFLLDKIIHTTDIELQYYFLNVQKIEVQ